jgi:hypothetical protein
LHLNWTAIAWEKVLELTAKSKNEKIPQILIEHPEYVDFRERIQDNLDTRQSRFAKRFWNF